MQTTLQVSVGTIKAQLCERGHFLFLRCLYWVKYGLLCNSWPSPRLFLDPSCVSRADVCDGKLQAVSEWCVPLSPHSLPHGTVNSSGAGSEPHSRVRLPGPPQLSKCFLDGIHPASYPHDHRSDCIGIWTPAIITLVCLWILIIQTPLIKKKKTHTKWEQ